MSIVTIKGNPHTQIISDSLNLLNISTYLLDILTEVNGFIPLWVNKKGTII